MIFMPTPFIEEGAYCFAIVSPSIRPSVEQMLSAHYNLWATRTIGPPDFHAVTLV